MEETETSMKAQEVVVFKDRDRLDPSNERQHEVIVFKVEAGKDLHY